MEYMVSFEDILKRGTCCICTKPLHDSKYLSLAQVDKKAAWKFPVWNNFLMPGLEDRAVGIVCDGCHEAAEKSGVSAKIKYAVEIRGEEIILHDVDELEDVEPVIEPEKSPDIPEFFTGSMNDQRHGFFCGLN
jgi:hypothetical protein